jgi:hypothetical protein
MQISSKTGTERNLAVELVLEDLPGGLTIEKDDFPTSCTGMKEGSPVGLGTDGVGHLFKTAMVVRAVSTNDANLMVYENHEFKVGDYLGNTVALTSTSAVASGAIITAITASGAGLNAITCAWAGPALAASAILVAVSGAGRSPMKYTLTGISTNTVDLEGGTANQNTGCGVVVRGRVQEKLMPYYVDSTLKALLPVIRFV